jgi:hypothetical protein
VKRSYPVGNRNFGKTGKRPIAFVGKLETSDRISWVGWGRVYRDCLWVLNKDIKMGIINFLRNLASQLAQFIDTNDGGNGDNSEGEDSQEYANFIGELLKAEAASNSGIQVIYPILKQRQHLLNARFAETLKQVVQNLIAEPPIAIELIVGIIENLSIHISDFPLGSRANNIEIAITGFQIVLNCLYP